MIQIKFIPFFIQGRTSVVHIKQATKRIHKETGVPCVNIYGYFVSDGEWQRMESHELDKVLYTNPKTGFKMPRGMIFDYSSLELPISNIKKL